MKGALTSALLIGAASLVNAQTTSTTFSFSFYCGKSTLSESNNIAVSLAMTSDEVTIMMSGPGSDWFGIGFGASSMDGTYAIIVEGDGSVSERKLGDHTGGSELTASVDVNGTIVQDDIRYIMMSRALDVGDSDYYTFAEAEGDISVIWGTSDSATFEQHTSKGTGTVSVSEIDIFNGGDITQCTLITGNLTASTTGTGTTGDDDDDTTGGDDTQTGTSTGTTGDDDDDDTTAGDDDTQTGTGTGTTGDDDDDTTGGDDDDDTTAGDDDDDDDDDDDAGSDGVTHGVVLFGYMIASVYIFGQMI